VLRFEEVGVFVSNKCNGVSGSEERTARTIVGGEHGGEESSDSSASNDIKEIGDPSLRIASFEADLVLKVDESSSGHNASCASTINA
jgi:hypothetical protein